MCVFAYCRTGAVLAISGFPHKCTHACWQNGLVSATGARLWPRGRLCPGASSGETGVWVPATRQTEHLSLAAGDTHLVLASVPPVDLCPAQYKLPATAHHMVFLLYLYFGLLMLKRSDPVRVLMY